jgi:hypothetical protein
MSNILNKKFRLRLIRKTPDKAAFIGQNWLLGLDQVEKPLLELFLHRHDYKDNHDDFSN